MGKESVTTIKVKLRKDGERDVLEFCLNPSHILDLNQDDQGAIKSMFCTLLLLLKEKAILLELEVEEGFDSELMKEVADDYVESLNMEIDSVRTKLVNEYINTIEDGASCNGGQ